MKCISSSRVTWTGELVESKSIDWNLNLMRGNEMIFSRTSLILFLILVVWGCAGPNPNVGERTTDVAWTSGRYQDAVSTAEPHAIAGEPWAQLRMGIFCENGWGVNCDISQAVTWYKKAMQHKDSSAWSNGQMIGAIGKNGYFNQNSDAIIAEYNLASIYFRGTLGKSDLVKAYVHISNVIADSNGETVHFCCNFEGGRGFDQEMFSDLWNQINEKISDEQLLQAKQLMKE